MMRDTMRLVLAGLIDLSDSPQAGDVSVKSRGWSFTAGVGVPIG